MLQSSPSSQALISFEQTLRRSPAVQNSLRFKLHEGHLQSSDGMVYDYSKKIEFFDASRQEIILYRHHSDVILSPSDRAYFIDKITLQPNWSNDLKMNVEQTLAVSTHNAQTGKIFVAHFQNVSTKSDGCRVETSKFHEKMGQTINLRCKVSPIILDLPSVDNRGQNDFVAFGKNIDKISKRIHPTIKSELAHFHFST